MDSETDEQIHFVEDLEERSNATTLGDFTTTVVGECPEKCW
ncbi:hypothetical protein RBH26_08150 [Natronolimnohabitans sp. A-GB9]|nr:hypothetical protein [Natronolimnohabitans sp. A-GB9]MDQ2050457.1 hypothetical protein [Natronolimnohabitans sp. A-GB9]